MDEKLKALIDKVRQSQIPETEKRKIFRIMTEALTSLVWPVLYKYVPKDRLNKMVKSTGPITVADYSLMITEAVRDGRALRDLNQKIDSVLVEMNRLLVKQGTV
ncbi:hypothetical protein A2Z33_03545 [Candidatus Gottesmanbacteria bacterium RBG_16_52_11]|uniref:Uncharacterized protein n=1 Tax=Candidatus Gottesmanbacteria bacterium RBG_16_52_11 TaxID=1798374 RepID=A0A1F5YVF9_9BACT|nr:MAG: hypothetical protein A2Z33_03545 [Candidatus Gottesmanbacteria bacterium RBG_16_52_11]